MISGHCHEFTPHTDHKYYRVLNGKEETAYCPGQGGNECNDPNCTICHPTIITNRKGQK